MFSMPSLVFGPVLVPPWMRQRLFFIAGDPQGVLRRRVLAPQRGAALAALMPFSQARVRGLLSVFIATPDAPGNNGLTSIADIDVLDGENLCTPGA